MMDEFIIIMVLVDLIYPCFGGIKPLYLTGEETIIFLNVKKKKHQKSVKKSLSTTFYSSPKSPENSI